ncbi:MAG: DMT family transporter [Alphaproteobacteria bacterium]|nr:DMT family transporter [Alphaproteobacteria bacterium]
MTIRTWAVLLLTAVLFGSSFLFIKIAVTEIPPVTIAAGRVVIAAPLVWLFLRLMGGRLPPLGAGWRPLILLGFLTGVIPFTAIAWGQLHIESGLAGILFGTIPVFSVLLTPFIAKDERLTPTRLLGAFVGVAGVSLVVGPTALGGLDSQLLGASVTLLAALSYAVGATYTRRRMDLSPVMLAAGQLTVAALILAPLSLSLDAPWTLVPSTGALAALAAVAVFSTAVPMLLLFWLIRRAGASNASLAAFFMPVVAVTLGAVLLGEALPWQAFAGLALILFGAAAVSGRFSRPLPQTS